MIVVIVSMVKELCDCIGFVMMECKKVLIEVNGDIELVIDNFCKFG